jgi:hypothetical protein
MKTKELRCIQEFILSILFYFCEIKTELRGFSSQGNYTDPSDRRLSAKLVLTFTDKGCRVVSVTDSHDR